MDQLEVIITREFTLSDVAIKDGKYVPDELDCASFYINGTSFNKMVCEALNNERDNPDDDYCVDIGLNPEHILIPYEYILVEPEKTESVLKEENGKIMISRCGLCGELLCGGFALRVTVKENTVIWDQIGYWHDTRTEGVAGPFEFNRKEYEQALRIEHAEYWTGRAYDEGTYVEKDPEKAMRYFKSAAERGYIPAQSYLGR